MKTILTILEIWCGASIVLGLFVGRLMAVGSDEDASKNGNYARHHDQGHYYPLRASVSSSEASRWAHLN